MSLLAYYQARLAASAEQIEFGVEDFATYPNVSYPDYPLGAPRWFNNENVSNTYCSVDAGVGIVAAQHNATDGLRYSTQADTAGKEVQVTLDWYPNITDEVRRIFIEVNGVTGSNLTLVMYYFAENSVQVGVSTFGPDSHERDTQPLIGRPNNALQLSTSEPTILALYVPDDPQQNVEARTWGQSQPRPAVAPFAVKLADLRAQFGSISQAGQLVLRSIQGNIARIRKIFILSKP